MNTGIQVDKCLSFIRCDISDPADKLPPQNKFHPVVTLSRQTGCDAASVATALAENLQRMGTATACTWTVFDRNLVARVLEEHRLPEDIAKYMPEDRVSAIQDAVEELLGLHPSFKTLIKQTNATIRRLAMLGGVIVIGRGGNIITRDMANVFHVRLMAPLEWRIARIMARENLDHKTAAEMVRKNDSARKHYLHDHFHAEIDDPLQYDLVLNVSRLPLQGVMHTIAEAVLHWAHASAAAPNPTAAPRTT